jgi:hypothetical protein
MTIYWIVGRCRKIAVLTKFCSFSTKLHRALTFARKPFDRPTFCQRTKTQIGDLSTDLLTVGQMTGSLALSVKGCVGQMSVGQIIFDQITCHRKKTASRQNGFKAFAINFWGRNHKTYSGRNFRFP